MPAKKLQTPPTRARFLLVCGMLALVVAALVFVWLRYETGAAKTRDEFTQFVRAAAAAGRTDDLAKMRRLYLNDAFLTDAALRQVFADFARLREEDLAKIEPDFEDDTYCWLHLPDSPMRHKLVRSQGDWVIQGDVVPLDR